MSLGDDVLEPISLELGMTPMNERMHAYHYNHVLTNSPTKRRSPQSQSARSDVGVQCLRKIIKIIILIIIHYISETGEATPIKLGTHAQLINLYLHELFGGIP